MREGSLEAPTRNVIDWTNPEYIDTEKIDVEMRRQFDICHGCRRCFNLCDSFPRLFDLIDSAEDDELEGVKSGDFKQVVDACTLCDMCFLTKCPYVPPHEFNIDFPHLMLRYRAAEQVKQGTPFFDKQLTETDRNGKLGGLASGLTNWATKRGNTLTRRAMEKIAGVHRDAELPKFHGKTFAAMSKQSPPGINPEAPAYGRKAIIFATCFANYNNPGIGEAALSVIAKNGIDVEVSYPGCCGMPQLEQGDLARVAEQAKKVAAELRPYIDQNRSIITLVPSCALMMKFEWPLIVTDDDNVKALAKATYDITEYIVDIANREGMAKGLSPLPGGVALHLACHARAQNMGPKAAEMLRLIPEVDITIVERCSSHGGTWGIKKKNFEFATKFARQTVRKAANAKKLYLASECPLAGKHLAQGFENLADPEQKTVQSLHPIQILAKSYGFE
ncbi:MAG TPA: glycerol-3-phosphate dehydrogenase [Rhodospirillaceae bacterium]|nr:glycerol-3-phosphate dehydrogenase [Candidatus Neomarinimicrobiota bacterium]HCX14396.1 glycerol-3-phosphate dehydrogenase [Rhodospirillaceae bacterium]